MVEFRIVDDDNGKKWVETTRPDHLSDFNIERETRKKIGRR